MTPEERWRRDHQVGKPNPPAELDAEIDFHLEELVARLRDEGMSAESARKEALRRFGALGPVRAAANAIDHHHDRHRSRLETVRDWLCDVKFAGRLLRRSPGFALLAASCIGLGVGVTGAILSAAYSILIRPLPYPRAEELIAVYGRGDKRPIRGSNISYPDYVAWRDRNRTLASLGIWTWRSFALTDGTGEAERINGAEISSEVFPLLGVTPTLGRLFGPEDAVQGAGSVILLGHGLWTRRYGADSAVIGRPIMVDGRPTVVIGVMPPKFAFPDGEVAWVPFIPEPNEEHQNRGYAGAVGRLKPGTPFSAAAADFLRIDLDLERELPNENLDWRADVIPLRDDLVGSLRRPLQVFMAAVGCLLLIVSANLANLLLARGLARRREMAVRSAIGAGRGRLLRQLLIESLTLSLLGGIIGVAVAAVGIRLLALTFPEGVPFFLTLTLDPTAIAITLGATVATGVVAGIIPAIRTAGFDLAAAFRDGGSGAGGGGASGGSGRTSRVRSALVIAEIALSIVLVVSGGLLIRSFSALATTDLGFDRRGLVTARITLPRASYPDAGERALFYQTLIERLGAIPGVTAAGSAQGAPMSGWNVQSSMVIEGNPGRDRANQLVVHYQLVSPSYFAALGLPILRGRGLTAADRDTANMVGVINEVLARQEFGEADPVGRRIRWGQSDVPEPNPRWVTIVGVVKSYRHYRLPDQMGPALYLPYVSNPTSQQDLVVRTNAADPLAVVPAIRAAVRQLDPSVPLFRVGTFDQTLARVLWQQRLQGQVAGVFAVLALTLATIGIYGVISYSVSQRTRELGIRAAVGASTGDLTRLVVREGGVLAVWGIGIGVLAAFAFARLLTALLYRVGPTDAVTFLAAPALIGAVTLAASWLPARRAARADPLVAIRD